MRSLLEIDEVTIGDHSYLTSEDKCFYFMEYHARQGFDHSKENSLIMNLKKPMEKKGLQGWQYKGRAIDFISQIVKEGIINLINLKEFTFVPMPPSKVRGHALYDDRILQILEIAGQGTNIDIRELLLCRESKDAVHEVENRPTIEELQENTILDEGLCDNMKPNIIIFDDVLTTGAHYIACKNILQDKFPEAIIRGVFVARRAIPIPEPDEEGWAAIL